MSKFTFTNETTFVFRRLREGEDSLVTVSAPRGNQWQELRDTVGDDWLAYQLLGEQDTVDGMLDSPMWGNVSELPMKAMAMDAPIEP